MLLWAALAGLLLVATGQDPSMHIDSDNVLHIDAPIGKVLVNGMDVASELAKLASQASAQMSTATAVAAVQASAGLALADCADGLQAGQGALADLTATGSEISSSFSTLQAGISSLNVTATQQQAALDALVQQLEAALGSP